MTRGATLVLHVLLASGSYMAAPVRSFQPSLRHHGSTRQTNFLQAVRAFDSQIAYPYHGGSGVDLEIPTTRSNPSAAKLKRLGLHSSLGKVHLLIEIILQGSLLSRPTHVMNANKSFILGRMILGTAVSLLGMARQNTNESLLEKSIVSFGVGLNVWMTFLSVTEYTFPLKANAAIISIDNPWLLPMQAFGCSMVVALAAWTLFQIAFAPNKDRKLLWAMGKSGRTDDRLFAVSYNSLLYIFPLIFYAMGSWSVSTQVHALNANTSRTHEWRDLLLDNPALVNIFGNTLVNTLFLNNLAIFLMTVGKYGWMKTGHITSIYGVLQGFIMYRAVEAMTVSFPLMASIGIRLPFYQ